MYNAASVAVFGSENLSGLLRALTSAELFVHKDYYAAHPHFLSLLSQENTSKLLAKIFTVLHTFVASDFLGTEKDKDYTLCVQKEALENCQNMRWSPFVCLVALSNVISLPIHSFYPETGGLHAGQLAVRLFNGMISPRIDNSSLGINLLWCKSGGSSADVSPSFKPDHIVPVFFTKQASLRNCTNDTQTSPPTRQLKISFPKKQSSASPLVSDSKSVTTSAIVSSCCKLPSVSRSHAVAKSSQEKDGKLPDYDIGSFHDKCDQLNDAEKFDVVQNLWKPDEKFIFPIRVICKKTRKFNLSWLSLFPWLAYSRRSDGAFCLPCVLFGRRIGKNSLKLQRLVFSPFTDWSCACKRFKEHEETSEIHKTSLLTMETFVSVMKNEVKPVDVVCNEIVNERVARNIQKLSSILKTVILCCRQNIPLRGHRDDSSYYDEKDCGNFQALLDFRVDSGDDVLKEHFATAPKNATYRSKTTQNDLIACAAACINEKIINEIKSCR